MWQLLCKTELIVLESLPLAVEGRRSDVMATVVFATFLVQNRHVNYYLGIRRFIFLRKRKYKNPCNIGCIYPGCDIVDPYRWCMR
jgi:hypothetical protein